MRNRAKIDKLGRVVIPISMRKELSLFEDCVLYLNIQDEKLIMTKERLTSNHVAQHVLESLSKKYNCSFILANENEIEVSEGKYKKITGSKISNDLLLAIEFGNDRFIESLKITNKDVINEKMHFIPLQGKVTRGCLLIIGETDDLDFVENLIEGIVY